MLFVLGFGGQILEIFILLACATFNNPYLQHGSDANEFNHVVITWLMQVGLLGAIWFSSESNKRKS